MAYLYRHIRLDKNEVFYIGVGSDKTYRRANTKNNRNLYWYNIVNKTEYIVEILIDDISFKTALEKEIEFISLYGRKDLKKGTLCNLTDGGEGVLNYKRSKESCLKVSVALKGRVYSEETIEKMRKAKTGKILTEQHKKKISQNSKHIGHSIEERARISERMKGEKNYNYGKPAHKNLILTISKQVIDTSTGIVYKSIKEVSIIFSLNYSTLKNNLSGKTKKNKTNFKYL
jgi:hypothetical protein